MKEVPYGVTTQSDDLSFFSVEISYSSTWINLNDREKFTISAEGTRDQTQKSWRKITADSPFLGGNYLIHATPDMVMENVTVRVSGDDHTDLNDNMYFLLDLFDQFDYRLRWTTNEYREYWRCQLADATLVRNQVYTHGRLAMASFSVPRYPDVTRERIA